MPGRARRRAAIAAFALLIAGFVLLYPPAGRAQVPPITIPTSTTTTSTEPPPTTQPPPTTAPTTTTTETATTTTVTEETTTTTVFGAVPIDVSGAGTTETTSAPTTPALAPGSGPSRSVTSLALTPAAVSGGYGIGLAAVIGFALALIALSTHIRPGGIPMTDQRRTRLIIGFGCIGLAAIVGLVGYLKLSLEPNVNRQIPYLASAGMTLVLLAAVGGAFIVAEQLRTDDRRMDELEAAVRTLASALSTSIEAPARRGGHVVVVESDAADAAESAEAKEVSGRTTTRRRR